MTKKIIFLSIVNISTLTAQTEVSLVKPISFQKKIHLYGDARIRHQEVQRTDKTNSYQGRYRIRLGVNYDITHNLTFEIQSSSGKGNPTSGNVKVDDGIDINKFKFDILNIDYKKDNNRFKIGRSKYLFHRAIKSQLIWDNDIRLDGLMYSHKQNNQFTIGLAKINRLAEDKNSNHKDIYLLTTQYMYQLQQKDAHLNIATGIYYYHEIKGNTAPYKKGALGNSYSNGGYENNYHILEVSAEENFSNFLGKPFKLGTTFAYNTAVKNHNFAYDISLKIGSTKKNYDWQIGYTYRNLERDSVFSAHNDSDFIAGGSDGKGHIITTKMKISKHMDIAGHFQWSKKFIDSDKSEADYHRIMLDMIVKF